MNLRLVRSLRLPEPQRGRALRSYFKKIPGGARLLDHYHSRQAAVIARQGALALRAGRPEGRRYLTAIPHSLCGIGHAFSEWHTAYQWAPLLALEHINLPLRGNWHEFLGAGNESVPYSALMADRSPVLVRLPYAAWSRGANAFPSIERAVNAVRSDRDLLFILADGQNAYDHTSSAAVLRKAFRERGLWGHLPRHGVSGSVNVAIHIRRGDVVQMAASDSRDWRERLIGEDYFARLANTLANSACGRPFVFHVYSQGAVADFPLLARLPGGCFHLDTNEQETLLNMALADILVMSPSGFSYLAALLSEGLKVARAHWWHHYPDHCDWIRLEPHFNEAAVVGATTAFLNQYSKQ